MERSYDIIIIGAGAVGCAVARELSRYQLSVAVLEKNSDVAGETTGRNSAVVHAGFNNWPGSRMASLCVKGNEGFEALCRNLDVPYQKTGKVLVAFDEEDERTLERLLEQGRRNGCRGLEILRGQAAEQLVAERLAKARGIDRTFGQGDGRIRAVLWSPNTAITNPFLYCVALAENAQANGVQFFLNTEVTGIQQGAEQGFEVRTRERGACPGQDSCFRSRYLINCAGLQADRIARMAGIEKYHLYPCRGEYFILDKQSGDLLPMPLYPAPRKGAGGLGVHLTPTIEGNIIIGPSAEYLEPADDSKSRSDYACTRPVMEQLMEEARQLMPEIAGLQPIGNYSGIRPKLAPPEEGGYHDFVICAEEEVPGLIDLVGIESPGLTASVPIAREVCRLLDDMEREESRLPDAMEGEDRARCTEDTAGGAGLQPDSSFIGTRRGILRFREQPPQRQAELIEEDPDYGEIICRCQKITKREIREAIENPLGARSISAIKYRAWATTGRCNGGYCLPKIAEILVQDYGMSPEEIRYRDPGSEMFPGFVK